MRAITIASVLLASLTGCSLIPRYTRPALPVSGRYPIDADAKGQIDAPDIGWRDFFADPVMGDLIALSLANNRDLRVAIENVAAAQAQYRSAHASLFPTIDATASGEFQRVPGGASGFAAPEHINAYSLGLSAASYELDVFGKIRSQAAQAHEDSSAAPKHGKARRSRWWRRSLPNISPGSPTAIPSACRPIRRRPISDPLISAR